MQQPELGARLTALRKEKQLTQEELVEKSHVSVRTIQRIESGEVLPRTSTVKILLEALGESYESFSTKPPEIMETKESINTSPHRNIVLTGALAGAVYLICEIILGALDVSWLSDGRDWGLQMNGIYISMTVVTVVSFALFARGFIALAELFENSLLKIAAILLIVGKALEGVLNISTLSADNFESIMIPYIAAAVIMGTLSLLFGIALLRLQDGMGELSRIAGILEIVMGCCLITVILFLIGYVVMIPATLVEILVLYRAYEYLSGAGQRAGVPQ